MKNLLIFCSANDLEEKYTKPAVEFAHLLVKNGYDVVWGGSDKGLMKEIVSAVQSDGGKIIGVSVEMLKHQIRENADEMIVAKDLSERKAIMLARCDGIVVLVGGIGTLDEITEMLELKKQKKHNKPIVILNTENFYEGLKVQMHKMKDGGFLPRPLEELIYFADTPNEVIEYVNRNLK